MLDHDSAFCWNTRSAVIIDTSLQLVLRVKDQRFINLSLGRAARCEECYFFIPSFVRPSNGRQHFSSRRKAPEPCARATSKRIRKLTLVPLAVTCRRPCCLRLASVQPQSPCPGRWTNDFAHPCALSRTQPSALSHRPRARPHGQQPLPRLGCAVLGGRDAVPLRGGLLPQRADGRTRRDGVHHHGLQPLPGEQTLHRWPGRAPGLRMAVGENGGRRVVHTSSRNTGPRVVRPGRLPTRLCRRRCRRTGWAP